MTATPPPDIESTVAAFRDQLETASIIDLEQVALDVNTVFSSVVSAPTHEDAAVCLREFADARPGQADYVRAVIHGMLAQLSVHIAVLAPITELVGDGGLLRRLLRLAYAVRGIEFGGL